MLVFSMTCRPWRKVLSSHRHDPITVLGLALPFTLFLTLLAPQISPQTLPDPPSPGTAVASDVFTGVVNNEKQSETLMDEYERTQRIEKRKAASDKTPTITCWRLFPTGLGVDKIALDADGKPSNIQAYRNELEKLEKYLAWVVEDGGAQKEAYQKADRRRKERFGLMEATRDAFLFTFEGKEMRGGRVLLRYRMEPNPAFRPTTRNTILFTRVRGTLWVDEQASQLAKIDGSVVQDVSLALFLAKVYKGSHFMQERYEVLPGLWEPTFEQYDFDGRKYLVPFSIHERTFYSEYRHIGPPKQAIQVVRAELNKLQVAESAK
jgi:hypothetical protein